MTIGSLLGSALIRKSKLFNTEYSLITFPALKDCTFLVTSYVAKDTVITPGLGRGDRHRKHAQWEGISAESGSRILKDSLGKA